MSPIKVFLGCVVIFTLFLMDIITWAIGFMMEKDNCQETICLNKWLLFCGILSMYFNFFRLWDLVHLYITIDDENARVGFWHYFFRISFEIFLALFHFIVAIIGIFLIPKSKSFLYFTAEYLHSLTIAILCVNICYIFVSL